MPNSKGTPGSASVTSTTGHHSALYTNTDHIEKVNALAWSPDGKYIVEGDAFGKIQLWQPEEK